MTKMQIVVEIRGTGPDLDRGELAVLAVCESLGLVVTPAPVDRTRGILEVPEVALWVGSVGEQVVAGALGAALFEYLKSRSGPASALEVQSEKGSARVIDLRTGMQVAVREVEKTGGDADRDGGAL